MVDRKSRTTPGSMAYSRTNNATRAEIDLSGIFASGTFKNVWKGKYIEGARNGQACVSKEFKTGSVYEDHYFREELAIVKRAQTIIDHFHEEEIIGRKILLNTPQIWQYQDTGHKSLIEPMIENFEKFNSNTGWAPVTGTAWSEAMQALSHFSYHDSGGQFLLCDLQGGVYSDGYVSFFIRKTRLDFSSARKSRIHVSSQTCCLFIRLS